MAFKIRSVVQIQAGGVGHKEVTHLVELANDRGHSVGPVGGPVTGRGAAQVDRRGTGRGMNGGRMGIGIGPEMWCGSGRLAPGAAPPHPPQVERALRGATAARAAAAEVESFLPVDLIDDTNGSSQARLPACSVSCPGANGATL